jgi:hypothetical protein
VFWASRLEKNAHSYDRRLARAKALPLFAASISLFLPNTAVEGRSFRAVSAFDGPWHLTFVTQAGACDQTYAFDVNIANGAISHPNLVMFRGHVRTNGAVRASVTVHDKYASGSGRLDAASGKGTWRGRSGPATCSGYWIAQRG